MGIFQVRCDPEVQELRRWQKKLREDKHIRERVKVFWARQEQKGQWFDLIPSASPPELPT